MQQRFLLQILLLAQHVSGTIVPIIRSSRVLYTQTVHRTTQNKQYIEEHNNLWECGPCPVLARFTLAFALQLRKRHGKTCQGSRV